MRNDNDADYYIAVGNIIREYRENMGYSIVEISSIFGVTYQQWGKYEKGVNRIPVNRLSKFNQLVIKSEAEIGNFWEKIGNIQ